MTNNNNKNQELPGEQPPEWFEEALKQTPRPTAEDVAKYNYMKSDFLEAIEKAKKSMSTIKGAQTVDEMFKYQNMAKMPTIIHTPVYEIKDGRLVPIPGTVGIKHHETEEIVGYHGTTITEYESSMQTGILRGPGKRKNEFAFTKVNEPRALEDAVADSLGNQTEQDMDIPVILPIFQSTLDKYKVVEDVGTYHILAPEGIEKQYLGEVRLIRQSGRK